jgi:hypothetical protein
VDRLLANASGSVVLNLIDANGAPVSAGAAVSAAVTDSNRVSFAFGSGTAIASSPFTAVESPTGTYTITIPAASITIFDTYDVVWTWTGGNRRETQFEVVGSFIFSLPDLRAMDTALADTAVYTVAKINKLRAEIENEFEAYCNQSFIRRGFRFFLDGTNNRFIHTTRYPLTQVISASVQTTRSSTAVALSAQELSDLATYADGWIERTDWNFWIWGWQNVELLVRYGWEQTPEDIRQAALLYAKARFLGLQTRSDLDRAQRWSTADLTVERADHSPTGYPDVDKVLAQYAQGGVMIG